jgi:hypothetical protein
VNPINLISDTYERKARLYPALLLVAPVIVVALAMLSSKLSAVESLTAGVIGFGGAFLLNQVARDEGKKREKQLFVEWGGLPSIAIFRHSDDRLDPVTKARYHKKLSALVKDTKAPTADEEKADPAAADVTYSAWSHFLRVSTRDTKKFSLLFHENVNYGYRRNIVGLRPFGIILCVLSLFAAAARVYFVHNSTGQWDAAVMGAAALCAILLLLWLFRFRPDWVRVPADAYAARLAESVEAFGSKTTRAPRMS